MTQIYYTIVGCPIVGVSYLAPTSKFIVRVLDPRRLCGGRKIYIGLDIMSLLLVIGGLHY